MTGSGIPLDKAGVFSTVLEGVLYGFSVFMFIGTIWALYTQRSTKEVNKLMVGIACMLLLLSTMHLICDIVRIEEGLVLYRDTYPGGPPVWFADVSQTTFNIKNGIYIIQTIIGDAVVIYRCYAVWQSFWVIIPPLLGLCAVVITGSGGVYECVRATTNATDVFFNATGQWIMSFYASTFATNFSATALLVYRIWNINRSVSGVRATKSSLMPVLLIIIDTGILYSATLMATLICFVRKSNGQYVVLDMICPIISIAFYMVIIRIAIQRTSTSRGAMKTNLGGGATTLDNSGSTGFQMQRQSTGRKPLEVHITQFTENEGETDGTNSMSKRGGSQEV